MDSIMQVNLIKAWEEREKKNAVVKITIWKLNNSNNKNHFKKTPFSSVFLESPN